jgi:hypothetical protein
MPPTIMDDHDRTTTGMASKSGVTVLLDRKADLDGINDRVDHSIRESASKWWRAGDDESGGTDPDVTTSDHHSLRHVKKGDRPVGVKTVMDLTHDRDGGIAVHRRRPRESGYSPDRQGDDEILEMHESIQSMISFSDLFDGQEGLGNAEQVTAPVMGLEESTETMQSISITNLAMDGERAIDKGLKNKSDKKYRAPPSMTKSSSTVTTAATSKSSTDPGRFSPQGGEDQYHDEHHRDERYNECPTEDIHSYNKIHMMTPSLRKSRRSSESRACRSTVPQTVLSAIGLVVSPLAVDPSPGHRRIKFPEMMFMDKIDSNDSIDPNPPTSSTREKRFQDANGNHRHHKTAPQMLEQQEVPGMGCRASYFIPGSTAQGRTSMDSIHSRDFVPELPEPLPHRFDYDVDGCQGGSFSYHSNISETLSVPPSPIDRHLHSPGAISCSTVSSRLLQRLPRKSIFVPDLNSICGRQHDCGNTNGNARTKSVSHSLTDDADDPDDAGTIESNSFAHLEERPPTPVKRRQRLRSKKADYAAKRGDSTRSSSEPSDQMLSSSTKLRAAMEKNQLQDKVHESREGHHNAACRRTVDNRAGTAEILPRIVRSSSSTMEQPVNHHRTSQRQHQHLLQANQKANIMMPPGALVSSRKPRSSRNLK